MTVAEQIIQDVRATGVAFMLTDDGQVGLSAAVPDDLLSKAKLHKASIKTHLQDEEHTKAGLRVLERLAYGLPLSTDELQDFYQTDLLSIGRGEFDKATLQASLLALAQTKQGADDGCQECIEERTAIMQFDGGLPEAEALAQATVICMDEYKRRR